MPKLHPNQAMKALRPRAQSQSLHTHIQACVPRTSNPPSPPRHSSQRITPVWPTPAPMSCLHEHGHGHGHGHVGRRRSGYGYAFSTQAVQAAHVLSHRTPPSPSASASPSSVGNSIADADSLSHSALNTGSGSRPSPGHVGAVETEPPVVDFLDLGNGIGRKVRVFLIIFLGAVGVVEVLFWGRGVWVWYTGNGKGKGGGSGSWRDSYGAK